MPRAWSTQTKCCKKRGLDRLKKTENLIRQGLGRYGRCLQLIGNGTGRQGEVEDIPTDESQPLKGQVVGGIQINQKTAGIWADLDTAVVGCNTNRQCANSRMAAGADPGKLLVLGNDW